eukprot:508938_1
MDQNSIQQHMRMLEYQMNVNLQRIEIAKAQNNVAIVQRYVDEHTRLINEYKMWIPYLPMGPNPTPVLQQPPLKNPSGLGQIDEKQKEMKQNENNSNSARIKTNEALMRGVYSYGICELSPGQKSVISHMLQKNDVIVQALEGTGMTVAFCIAALQIIVPADRQCQVLIISPTEELVSQIKDVIVEFGTYLHVTVRTCCDEVFSQDRFHISRGRQIIIGTPGRVNKLIQREVLNLKTVQLVIMDHVQKCYNIKHYMTYIENFMTLKTVHTHIQSVTFTSFITDKIFHLHAKPKILLIRNPLRKIKKIFECCSTVFGKTQVLMEYFSSNVVTQSIIYCNTKDSVTLLEAAFTKQLFNNVCAIHGDMTQKQQKYNISRFKSGEKRTLITTDFLAKGMDMQFVDLVVHFDLPTVDNYIYRSTRCGIFGRPRTALHLYDENEELKLNDIEALCRPNIIGKRKILIVTTKNKCVHAINSLVSVYGNVIGLDCEFDDKQNVTLLQMANKKYVVLIRLHLLWKNSRKSFPSVLVNVLRNRNIVKCGVGIKNQDYKKLKEIGLEMFGMIDLGEKYGRNKIGLEEMAKQLLYKDMIYKHRRKNKKNKEQSTFKSNLFQLTSDQIRYASEDAIISYELYFKLFNNQ